MYSRSPDRHNRDSRIPPNYGGTIFERPRFVQQPPRTATAAQAASARPEPRMEFVQSPTERTEMPREEIRAQMPEELHEERYEDVHEHTDEQEQAVPASQESKSSILSPIGALGTEELLLIALALIIFQGGKEPELALILLALLFIN